jgi:protein-tyrosine-phosphatase
MSKNVLLLCNDNSALSIIAQAVLSKYLNGIITFSAGLKKVNPLNPAVKKALQKDGSWCDDFHAKSFESLADNSFDLVIILSNITRKQTPEFDENTTIIQIEYEEPNYSNSTNIERFIKTIKMELIPITRDILEL